MVDSSRLVILNNSFFEIIVRSGRWTVGKDDFDVSIRLVLSCFFIRYPSPCALHFLHYIYAL
jgi:hypothetical protein